MVNSSKTETLSSGSNTYVHEYLSKFILRATEELIHYENIALQNEAPYYRVKGPSLILKIMTNFINGTEFDWMFGVFLNSKQLSFDVKYLYVINNILI